MASDRSSRLGEPKALRSPALESVLAAKLEVFDAQGRRIATPVNGDVAVGRTDVTWDLRAHGAASVASAADLCPSFGR